MKFKVGDRVRVTNAVTDHRAKEVGKIYTVTNINRAGLEYYPRKGVNYCSFDDRESNYIFYEDELELVSFTKADLKDGMVVEYRNGVRRMVLDDKLIGYDGHLPMNSLRDDLCYDAVSVVKSQYDVVKVYKSSANIFNSYFEDYYLTLIWERPKSAKKMTVEEIEKELGYKVEIISKEN